MAALKYWVWLTTLPGLGERAKLQLLAHFGSPEEIYFAPEGELLLAEGITKLQAALLADKSLDRAEKVLEDCARDGQFLLTMDDAGYPARLRNIYDPPLLLYGKGSLPLFDDEVAVTVVGTRDCTPYGVRAASQLGYELARQGALLVSGMAKGIDGEALKGALRAGGFTAAVLGGALALAGFLMQIFFRNPIAGPFVLGISSGAKMTVALTMIFLLKRGLESSSWVLILSAFAGSLITMFFVLMISGKVGTSSLLVVCGVMVGYICSAITDFVITFAEDSDIINLHGWSQGSFSGMSWSNVRVASVIIAVAVILTFLLSKPIGAYQLGEAYAQSMGVNIKVFRVTLILLSSILSATVTAFAGPISFVGIAVPHLVKQALNTSRPLVVIPGTFLGGAVFCMLSDLIARTAFAPLELNISTVTSIFGAPVVIAMMLKRQKGKQ